MKENLEPSGLTRKYQERNGNHTRLSTIEHRWPNTRTITRPLYSNVDQFAVPDRGPPLPDTSKAALMFVNTGILHIDSDRLPY